MKNILIALLSLLLINGCGSSDSNDRSRTAYSLPKNSVSLGNPNAPTIIASIDTLPNKQHQFAWHNIFVPIVSAVELVIDLFRDTNVEQGVFSNDALNALIADHTSELEKFQGKITTTSSTFTYNGLLQRGESNATYASAGHLAYGLIWELWLAELSLRYQVYQEIIILNVTDVASITIASITLPATLTTQSSSYTVARGTATDNYFTGWAEGTNTLAIRSAFDQTEGNFTAQDSVEAVVSANSIAIVINKTGTPTTNNSDILPYKVTLTGTKDVSNTVEIAARLSRPGWITNIASQTITTDMGNIVFQARLEQIGSQYLMRVDYTQCPTISCELTTPGVITGSEVYNITNVEADKTVLNIGNIVTTTLATPSIAVPDFWTDANTTFRLSF